MPDTPPKHDDRLPTWRLVAAITVSVSAIVVVIVLARVVASRPVSSVADKLLVSAVDAPGAASPACAGLVAALPDPLAELPRRELEQGGDPQLAGVAAWGEPAVILRCGVPTPQELTCSAAIQEVDGVAWLPLSGSGATTYLAVDRPVRVALTIPDGVTNTGPWQQLSKVVAATLPEQPICAGGIPAPVTGG